MSFVKGILMVLGIFLIVGCSPKIELEPRSVLGDRVTFSVPSSFTLLVDEIREFKYPSENRPEIVFSNEEADINFAISWKKEQASQAMMDFIAQKMAKSMSARIKRSKLLDEGVKEVRGRKIGYIEIITPAMDSRIYNLIFFTDLEGRLLMFNFNCVSGKMRKWKPIGRKILASLTIEP